MDPKLVILILLIGTLIGLSNLNRENLAKLKNEIDARRLRNSVARRIKS